jgi:HEAT repeat protein
MSHAKLEKFINAPEGMESEDVRRLFEELLAMPKPATSEEATLMAEAFWEVADRQWHTYTRLDPTMRDAIDDWIFANWDPTSLKMTGWLIGVVGHVGLPKSVNFMRQALEGELPPPVRQRIQEALDEFGATVDDPYFKMKREQ